MKPTQRITVISISLALLIIVSTILILTSCSNVQPRGDNVSLPPVTAPVTETAGVTKITTASVYTESTSITSVSIIETENSFSKRLHEFLSAEENGMTSGYAAVELHHGDWNNACVYTVAEALRRIGEDIPVNICRTEDFEMMLESLGYNKYYDLENLEPGDICFTTDEYGVIGGRPTHTYVFLGWESPEIANVYDNQIYDYGSLYHVRDIGFSFLNGNQSKPKEATAFFMRKENHPD